MGATALGIGALISGIAGAATSGVGAGLQGRAAREEAARQEKLDREQLELQKLSLEEQKEARKRNQNLTGLDLLAQQRIGAQTSSLSRSFNRDLLSVVGGR